jgi:hypothetical protein
MRESPAFGNAKSQENPNNAAVTSLFGGKTITDKPADQDQPGICKPKAQVGESATKTSDDALFKQPVPPKSKNEAEIGKQNSQAQAPSGSLFGNKAASGAFSSSAESKKPAQGSSVLAGAASSSLFGGASKNDSQTKPSEEQTASSSNIKEDKASAFKETTSNPLLRPGVAASNPFLSASAA